VKGKRVKEKLDSQRGEPKKIGLKAGIREQREDHTSVGIASKPRVRYGKRFYPLTQHIEIIKTKREVRMEVALRADSNNSKSAWSPLFFLVLMEPRNGRGLKAQKTNCCTLIYIYTGAARW